jgi:hypothetical protein
MIRAWAKRQLPVADEIFLDHVGHFVSDAVAARAALARAGFAPTPMSVQTNPDPETGAPRLTGTGNTTAMLRRGYIEVLFKTADTPLARAFDDALSRYAGVHLAAFSVADAAVARERIAASGFRVRPLTEMQRPVETEAGPDIAAFTIARLEPGQMAEGRIQILTHKTEHTVWQDRWLVHPNGALGLCSIVFVVDDVEEAAQRFARFTDRPALSTPWGRVVHTDRGWVELVTAAAFKQVVREVPVPSLPFAGAYGLLVASLMKAETMLRGAGLEVRRAGHALVAAFPPELGQGAWLMAENPESLRFGA